MKTKAINKADLLNIIDYNIDSLAYEYDHLGGIYQLEFELFGRGWPEGYKQALQHAIKDLSVLRRIIKESAL